MFIRFARTTAFAVLTLAATAAITTTASAQCGGEGQVTCNANWGDRCDPGLVKIPGCTGDCTCGHYGDRVSEYTCHVPLVSRSGYYSYAIPFPGVVTPLEEPRTDAVLPLSPPQTGRRGYADLHVHLFGDLASGGAILAGKPYHDSPLAADGTSGGIAEALKQCRALPADQFRSIRKFCDASLPGLDEDILCEATTDGMFRVFPSNNTITSSFPPQCPWYLKDCFVPGQLPPLHLSTPLHVDHFVHGQDFDLTKLNTLDAEFEDVVGVGQGDREGTQRPSRNGYFPSAILELIEIERSSNLGWPVFNDWPTYSTTTHQQTYYKWLERAVQGGLRLIVSHAVTNEALCKSNKRAIDSPAADLYAGCEDSMASIDQQLYAMHAFEEFVDAQTGGPGQGWFRIVRTPDEADQVIAAGKLAVVLGIEVDNLFNCKNAGTPGPNGVCSGTCTAGKPLHTLCLEDADCDTSPGNGVCRKSGTLCGEDADCLCYDAGGNVANDSFGSDCVTQAECMLGSVPECSEQFIRDEVKRYYDDFDVRHVFPIHNFDNAFGAPATWQDPVNVGNRVGEGTWWAAEPCPTVGTKRYGKRLNSGGTVLTTIDTVFETLGLPPFSENISEVFYLLGFSHLRRPNTRHLVPSLNATAWPTSPNYVDGGAEGDLPDCNVHGLTPKGEVLIEALMDQGMLVDVDHMSNKAFDRTAELAETRGYPLVASHVVLFDRLVEPGRHERARTLPQLQKIADSGGMIGLMVNDDNPAGGRCYIPGAPPDVDGKLCDTNDGCVWQAQTYPCVGLYQGGVASTHPMAWREISQPYQPETCSVPPAVNDCWRSTKSWAQHYQYAVDAMGGIPVALASDFNGGAGHLGPRFGNQACAKARDVPTDSNKGEYSRVRQLAANDRLPYPFTLAGFGTFNRQKTGTKAFDYNVDGLAHIGLYPDFVKDLENVGVGSCYVDTLEDSADAYVRMWRRATVVASGCPAEPLESCLTAGKARFSVSRGKTPGKNKLMWKWGQGESVTHAQLGGPDTDTRYSLCSYDQRLGVPVFAGGLVVRPPDAGWQSKDPKGWRYKNKAGTQNGVTSVRLKTSTGDKSGALFKARGVNLPMPGPSSADRFFEQDTSMTVQVVNELGTCWTSEFVPASTSKNTGQKFSAKSP